MRFPERSLKPIYFRLHSTSLHKQTSSFLLGAWNQTSCPFHTKVTACVAGPPWMPFSTIAIRSHVAHAIAGLPESYHQPICIEKKRLKGRIWCLWQHETIVHNRKTSMDCKGSRGKEATKIKIQYALSSTKDNLDTVANQSCTIFNIQEAKCDISSSTIFFSCTRK